MANLDTENKRRSVTGVIGLFTIPPVPDSTLNANDRMQSTYLYSGIAPGAIALIWMQTTIVGDEVLSGQIVAIVASMKLNTLRIVTLKTGATQSAAGAAPSEVWATSGHATLPDNVMMIGV